MQNKKIIILIILGMVAIFTLIYGLTSAPKGKKGLSLKQETAYQIEKAEIEKAAIAMKRGTKRTKFASWGRNPFLLKTGSASALCLTGILLDKENPKAIINDNIVSIGDKIAGNTVVNITEEKVILNDGAKDFDLKLSK